MPRFGLAVVRGRSMEPTLRAGDRLLVRYGARPRPGVLALVELPRDEDGLPRPLAVKRVTRAHPLPDGTAGWWVERDNPREGVDSWVVGALPADAVRAVVVCRLPRVAPFRRPPWARRLPGARP